jgi:hypothetical protein
MSEKTVCPHCGYAGPVDARFCAQCGRALVSPGVRWIVSINRILDNLSPIHIGFLGLILSVLISVFVDRLIVTELAFPLTLVPIALVIGCGYAYLGWHGKALLSSRSHLVRMLVIFVCMGVILVAVWLVDRGALSLLSDRTHMVVYEVPGVYRESSPGFRKLSIASSVPPYWLAAMVYGVLIAVFSNLIHGAFERRSK